MPEPVLLAGESELHTKMALYNGKDEIFSKKLFRITCFAKIIEHVLVFPAY